MNLMQQNSQFSTPIKSKYVSLTTYQKPRKNECNSSYLLLLIVFALVFAICFYYFKSDESKSIATIQSAPKIPNSENYIDRYCKMQGKCSDDDQHFLKKMIEMMQSIQQTQNGTLALQGSINGLASFQDRQNSMVQVKISSQFQKQIPLEVVKHQKLTSPKARSTGFFNAFISIFLPSREYNGIELIFDPQNDEPWISSGNLLAVRSEQYFSIASIHIVSQIDTTMMVFGLRVDQTLMAVQHRLMHTFLGKYQVSQNENTFECTRKDCQNEYVMLLFVMKDPIKITRLRLTQKIYI